MPRDVPRSPVYCRMADELAAVLAQYLELRWRIDPVEATAAGVHAFDGAYADYGREAVRAHAAALRSYATALEELSARSLDQEIDRTAALHMARYELLVLERQRPFERDPALHLGHAMTGLFLLLARVHQDPSRRGAALLQRLQALPAFLDRAAQTVASPAAVFVESARAMLPGSLALVRQGLEGAELAVGAVEPLALAEARREAEAALLRYGDALALMEERADDRFAIGRELFDRTLATAHLLPGTADEMARFGERLRGEATATLTRLAAELAPGVEWRFLVERLREEGGVMDDVLGAYRDAMREAHAFTAERGLVTVPEVPLDVVATPPFLRALIPIAAYQPPGAYDEARRGTFFVTTPEAPAAARPSVPAELRTTALHEGVPGHHLHLSVATALPQPVRRVLATPAALEGWALYCESLMSAEGFLASAAERFFQAHHLLWRALRVVIDVGLHTRGLGVGAAVALLRDELGMPEGSARAEVRRYCATPTYPLCYAVGRREILRLRDDARRARGEAFSLRAFHDELLSYGALPTALARWGMGLA